MCHCDFPSLSRHKNHHFSNHNQFHHNNRHNFDGFYHHNIDRYFKKNQKKVYLMICKYIGILYSSDNCAHHFDEFRTRISPLQAIEHF